MDKSLTFQKLAEIVLEQTKIPLTYVEIWDEAVKSGLSKNLNTKGKTPWDSISAQIYVDIRDNPNSVFYQYSKRPTKFGLKRLSYTHTIITPEKKDASSFHERDLHPLVSRFINTNQHFKALTKTIFHESSSNTKKGLNEWLHPDITGVYLPFSDYDEVTLKLQKSLSLSAVKLFSFELKKELTFSNLRQSYFQAVSNSSWAHEGYLVISKMAEDPDFIDELRRLNNAFGIGILKINIDSPDESEILFQSFVKPELDWSTINRLVEENPNFKQFMEDIEEDLQLRKIKGKYDNVLSDEELAIYTKAKKIVTI
ncbi:HTH domain-containing protein [Methanosarcina sp. UBA411]|jgi:hypothetical protein|uniref:HTH domain-containing protein n=1 Tax=Methanosarcina sp. UBA411 TaxID=1915589 RepID=UPI0025E7ED85|nr:HTH domain-containing protein [Methanosarcina sp. UBA411]